MGKRSKTVTICQNHEHIHIEHPKGFTKKNCRINKFSKVAGYKISIQKSVTFLYTNNKLSKIGIKKSITFTIASKWTKYLGINLAKEVKYLYTKNHKTVKEFEKGIFFCAHGLGEKCP